MTKQKVKFRKFYWMIVHDSGLDPIVFDTKKQARHYYSSKNKFIKVQIKEIV